jgi:hypothetical protein
MNGTIAAICFCVDLETGALLSQYEPAAVTPRRDCTELDCTARSVLSVVAGCDRVPPSSKVQLKVLPHLNSIALY